MTKQQKEKNLRSLIDASRLYDRARIEDAFKEKATYRLLTVPETEEGLNLVRRLFTNDIENDSLLYELLNKRFSENVTETFISTLQTLDKEMPIDFLKCKSIYEIREKMLDFGYTSEDKLVDGEIEFSFIGYSYSAKYRLTLQKFTLENVAKIADLTLRNGRSFKYFTRSLI